MRKCLFLIVLCLAAPVSAQPLNVVASFSVLQDIARQIGGDKVIVSTLVKPGQDPHAFEFAPQDVVSLRQAGLLIINGLGFEPWQDRLVSASDFKGQVVIATKSLLPRMATKALIDPHAWQSLAAARIYVANIERAFEIADPDNQAYYRARAKLYLARLALLKQEIAAKISLIPVNRRVAIVIHDGIGYFGDEFGVDFYPVSHNDEAMTPADLINIAKIVRQRQIKTLFAQAGADSRLLSQVESETGLPLSGRLFIDSLPEGLSYLETIRANATLIQETLIRSYNSQAEKLTVTSPTN